METIILMVMAFVLAFLVARVRRIYAHVTRSYERTSTGLIRIGEDQFTTKSASRFNNDVKPFPERLRPYIKNFTSSDVAQWLFDIESAAQDTTFLNEVRRAITLSAALFDRPIPERLLCIDGRTQRLYRRLKREMEIVFVDAIPADDARNHSDERHAYLLTDKLQGKALADAVVAYQFYSELLPKVGAIIMQCATVDAYPSLEIFIAKYRAEITTRQSHYTVDEDIAAMITAYGILAKFPIPKAYVLYNGLTMLLIHGVPDTAPYLAVVK